MEEIKITYTDSGFYVRQGDKQAEMLGWDEMLGTIAALTMPNPCPCLGWMKTKLQFKDGCFVVSESESCKWIAIIKGDDNDADYYHSYFGMYTKKQPEEIPDYWFDEPCDAQTKNRPATEEEKQTLLDALHKEGKDWDAEKKEIVEYKWRPKEGETYYFVHTSGVVGCNNWYKNSADEKLFSIGNCFKTIEEAEEMLMKMRDILKKSK